MQREKLAQSQMEPYFEAVFVSGEIGIGKPDPKVFAVVLERLGISAENAVMVGDNLKADVAGAQRAGIRGIWINRSGMDCDPIINPDAQISSLTELFA